MSTETLELSEFDEFAFLPIGRTLVKLNSLRETADQHAWPIPIPVMRVNYVIRPDLMDEPRMLRYEEQDEFISQMFLDINLYDRIQNPLNHSSVAKRIRLPFDDPLLASFRPLLATDGVTAKMVFAAQILFDIHEIRRMGTAKNGTEILQNAAGHYRNVFKFFHYPDGTLVTKDVVWHAKDANLMATIYCRIEHFTNQAITSFKEFCLRYFRDTRPPSTLQIQDIPPQVREKTKEKLRALGWTPATEEHERTAKRLGANKIVEPNQDPSFYINENPLFVGMLLLDVASMSEEAGVALANQYAAIFATAHLYNALIQLGICNICWPEMQQIINLHAGPIFAHDIPTNAADMLSRYTYRTGLTTHNRRRFDTKMPWKFQVTPAMQALRAFFSGKESLERVLGELAIQAQAHACQDKSTLPTSQGPARTAAQKRQHHSPLTPRHTLQLLESYIAAVLPDVELDYVNLMRRCIALMRQLRTQIAAKLRIKYSSRVTSVDPRDPCDDGRIFVFVVLDILDEARVHEAQRSSRKRKDQVRSSSDGDSGDVARRMMIAKEVLLKDLERTT